MKTLLLVALLLIPTTAHAAGRCTPGTVTPQLLSLNGGTMTIQAQSFETNCAKGLPPYGYHLHGSLSVNGVEVASADRAFACSTRFRPSCGTAIVFQTSLVCTDSNDPTVWVVSVEAVGGPNGAPNQRVSSVATFNCREVGGGD